MKLSTESGGITVSQNGVKFLRMVKRTYENEPNSRYYMQFSLGNIDSMSWMPTIDQLVKKGLVVKATAIAYNQDCKRFARVCEIAIVTSEGLAAAHPRAALK